MRTTIGELQLDEVLHNRAGLITPIKCYLHQAAVGWGLKVQYPLNTPIRTHRSHPDDRIQISVDNHAPTERGRRGHVSRSGRRHTMCRVHNLGGGGERPVYAMRFQSGAQAGSNQQDSIASSYAAAPTLRLSVLDPLILPFPFQRRDASSYATLQCHASEAEACQQQQQSWHHWKQQQFRYSWKHQDEDSKRGEYEAVPCFDRDNAIRDGRLKVHSEFHTVSSISRGDVDTACDSEDDASESPLIRHQGPYPLV
ncbi:hypothetical protein HJC23_000836 [Cyclotella cryptica]|uniref:Uncharacterized protein n=1 Tax=Cyclotella cryptica TaxID=29204 RepID=A0ABD3Q5S5_9STRA